MNYCIIESREEKHPSEWPIVFDGTLDQCRASLTKAGEPANDTTWKTKDGFQYYRGCDLVIRVICEAWWKKYERQDVLDDYCVPDKQ